MTLKSVDPSVESLEHLLGRVYPPPYPLPQHVLWCHLDNFLSPGTSFPRKYRYILHGTCKNTPVFTTFAIGSLCRVWSPVLFANMHIFCIGPSKTCAFLLVGTVVDRVKVMFAREKCIDSALGSQNMCIFASWGCARLQIYVISALDPQKHSCSC